MGPQIIKQDPAAGGFVYSMCNSKDTPIFPTNPPLMLSISSDYTPKNGTPLAGQGWYTSGTTWVGASLSSRPRCTSCLPSFQN